MCAMDVDGFMRNNETKQWFIFICKTRCDVWSEEKGNKQKQN